jgi:hypothetical protein
VQAKGKEPKDNPRFVVTNMKQSARWLYEEVYCAKATGDIPQNVNFAIRDGVATAFLDTLRIPYRTSGSMAATGWPAVARAERSMSVAIVCTE